MEIPGQEDGSDTVTGGIELREVSRVLLRTWLGRELRRLVAGGVGVGSETAALDSNPWISIFQTLVE